MPPRKKLKTKFVLDVKLDPPASDTLADVADRLQKLLIGLQMKAILECLKNGGSTRDCLGFAPPVPPPLSMLKDPYVKKLMNEMKMEDRRQLLQLLREQLENDLKTVDRMIARS